MYVRVSLLRLSHYHPISSSISLLPLVFGVVHLSDLGDLSSDRASDQAWDTAWATSCINRPLTLPGTTSPACSERGLTPPSSSLLFPPTPSELSARLREWQLLLLLISGAGRWGTTVTLTLSQRRADICVRTCNHSSALHRCRLTL
jgi:hypothetical protein